MRSFKFPAIRWQQFKAWLFPPVPTNGEDTHPFDAWKMAINVAARHIDPAINYNVTEDVPTQVLAALWSYGTSPEEAIYQTMTDYSLGAQCGFRLDGTARRSGGGCISMPTREGMTILQNAQGLHLRLTEQNKDQRGLRALRIADEQKLTKNKPLKTGLAVRIGHKMGRKATITQVITSEIDPRPLYEVVTDTSMEIVHVRAIDLWWKGRKK